MSTRHVVRCGTVFVKLILKRTLSVGFLEIPLPSVVFHSVHRCLQWWIPYSPCLRLQFSATFDSLVHLFLWTHRLIILSYSLMMHAVTFSSVFLALSLLPVSPPQVFDNRFCGQWFQSTKRPAREQFGSTSLGTGRGDAVPAKFGSMALHFSRLLPRLCREPTIQRWWTWTSVRRLGNDESRLRRVYKFSLRFQMNMVWSCSGSNGHFRPLCNRYIHTLQHWTLSRPSVESNKPTVAVKFVNDELPASFTETISTPSLLIHCQSDVFLDHSMFLIVFGGDLFDDYSNSAGYLWKRLVAPLGVLRFPAFSMIWRDTPTCATVLDSGYSSRLFTCASWTAVVFRRKFI